MARLDHSIYFQQKTPDILGGVQEGLSLRDMVRRDKEATTQKDFNEALKQSYTTDPNGVPVFNQARLSDLAKIDPVRAQQMKQEMDTRARGEKNMDLNDMMSRTKYGSQLLSGVEDEKTYQLTKPKLIQAGIYKPEELPPTLDKNWLKAQQYAGITLADRLKMQLGQADMRKTGAEIAKLNAETRKVMAESGTDGQGTKLAADKVMRIQEGDSVASMLPDISETIKANSDSFGPIAGRIGGMNPYDTKSQTIDAQMRASSQAFGRYMEGGVLRKEDEEKYRKMFPNLSDSKEVAENKLAIVQKLLVDRQRGDLDALTKAGYNTEPFNRRESPALPQVLGGGAPKSAPAQKIDYDNLSDDELAALYNQMNKGGYAKSR